MINFRSYNSIWFLLRFIAIYIDIHGDEKKSYEMSRSTNFIEMKWIIIKMCANHIRTIGVYRWFYANNNRHEIQLFTAWLMLTLNYDFFLFLWEKWLSHRCAAGYTLIEAYISSRMIHSNESFKKKNEMKDGKVENEPRYKSNSHTNALGNNRKRRSKTMMPAPSRIASFNHKKTNPITMLSYSRMGSSTEEIRRYLFLPSLSLSLFLVSDKLMLDDIVFYFGN